MNPKTPFAALLIFGCSGGILGGTRVAPEGRAPETRHDAAAFVKTIAGLTVRLVAVAETDSGWSARLADHAWTPEGLPYDGPQSRFGRLGERSVSWKGSRRCFFFEIQDSPAIKPAAETAHSTVSVPAKVNHEGTDVLIYLPKSRIQSYEHSSAVGPIPIEVWHGVPRDSHGHIVLAMPIEIGAEFVVKKTERQPVAFGIAQGEFHTIAKGAASVASLTENQTAIIASGRWGKIEAQHLPLPDLISAPPATHRLCLLGGSYPPKSERRVLFYDSKGNIVTSCGDGPDKPGFVHGFPGRPKVITSFEVQERPYKFVRFDNVSFDAPSFNGYSGPEGGNHAVNSPVGKVVGVLTPTKDGPWIGYLLHAPDGVRWHEPDAKLVAIENGEFDPWNRPIEDWWTILIDADDASFTPTTPISYDVYAADYLDGPRKEKLSGSNPLVLQKPITRIGCPTTARPYMRVEVRIGDGTWKTLQTIPITDRILQLANSASPGTRVLEVFAHDDGRVRIWTDEANPVLSPSKWRLRDQRIRAIAHLRNGTDADLDFNMSGYSGAPPNEKGYRGLEYIRQANGTLFQSGFTSIDIKEIASVDLQVQDLQPAVTFYVHSPKD